MGSILAGILLGGTICILNIKGLNFIVKYLLLDIKNVRKAKTVAFTVLFRYLLIAGVLYLSVKSHFVNIVAFIIGFSIVLFSEIAILMRQYRKDVKVNGRTSPLH